MIEDAASWLASQPNPIGDGRIGMMGISFAGGLSIVAAGRPALRDRLAFVLSFGGHGDLPRTLHYLSTGTQPDGTHRAPHDYGVAIILLGVADQVVPPNQAGPLRAAILASSKRRGWTWSTRPGRPRNSPRARTMADGCRNRRARS